MREAHKEQAYLDSIRQGNYLQSIALIEDLTAESKEAETDDILGKLEIFFERTDVNRNDLILFAALIETIYQHNEVEAGLLNFCLTTCYTALFYFLEKETNLNQGLENSLIESNTSLNEAFVTDIKPRFRMLNSIPQALTILKELKHFYLYSPIENIIKHPAYQLKKMLEIIEVEDDKIYQLLIMNIHSCIYYQYFGSAEHSIIQLIEEISQDRILKEMLPHILTAKSRQQEYLSKGYKKAEEAIKHFINNVTGIIYGYINDFYLEKEDCTDFYLQQFSEQNNQLIHAKVEKKLRKEWQKRSSTVSNSIRSLGVGVGIAGTLLIAGMPVAAATVGGGAVSMFTFFCCCRRPKGDDLQDVLEITSTLSNSLD